MIDEFELERLAAIAGNEALEYNQFVKLFATRERTSDITLPRYQAIGDVMLPRGSVFHYEPVLAKEVGPSNTAPFIANFDKRINMYFNYDYAHERGQIKIVGLQLSKIQKSYLAGHYQYHIARQLAPALSKPGELLVNNMAIGRLPVVYRRVTVQTPFDRSYNNLVTLINAANQFSSYQVQQFAEFKLPRSFPSFKILEMKFEKYRKMFFKKPGEVTPSGWDKETLKEFQAEESFWLLDLYGILMGLKDVGTDKDGNPNLNASDYSVFNRLNEKARSQFNMIFTYNGRCWIVNLQTLINLISYDDRPGEIKPSPLKVTHFKHFYKALISLVTPLMEEVPEGDNDENNVSESEHGAKTDPESSQEDAGLDAGVSSDPLGDLYAKPVQRESVGAGQQGSGAEAEAGHNSASQGEQSTIPDEYDSDRDGETSDSAKWGTDIPDEVFERATVEQAAVVEPDLPYTPTSTIERILSKMARQGQLTTRELEYFTRISQSYKTIDLGGITLEEAASTKPEDLVFEPEVMGTESPLVRNKENQLSRTTQLVKSYNQQQLERDIVTMILGVQQGGTALLELERETVITAESKFDVYNMVVQPIEGGARTKRPFRIPKVASDDTLTVGGVKMYSQLVRIELGVRKISPTKVKLTSYYDKSLKIERNPYKVNDYPAWLKAAIISKGQTDKGLTITLGGIRQTQKEVCWYYSVLASRFTEIQYGKYDFQFDTARLIAKHPDWKNLCTAKSWPIGEENGEPVLIDSSGMITVGNIDRGYIEEILGLNMYKAPIPSATISINGFAFPLGVVLSYWVGFSEVLKRLSPSIRTVEPGVRPQLGPDEYMIQLADERLIFDRREEFPTLVLSGLANLPGIKNFSRMQLDDPNVWFSMMGNDKVKPSHFKEMELIYDMFVDPITARELTRRKYSTVMDKLVLEAAELLLSNEASHEVDISEQRFVGTERMAGHVYRELVKSTRGFRNKPGSKKTFDLNPETIMMNILTDSSFQSVEEVNIVHQIKQQEEVTFGGSFGRSDNTMVRRTRGQLDNFAGIISEAGKDSGKVGYISYLTSDAKIVDMAGNVDVDLPSTKPGHLSITGNLLYGSTRDDTKRSLFAGVQLSQWMATDSYGPVPLQTDYDTQIAYRASELYSSVAKQDGKVTEITSEGILVEYTDGSTDKFFLGYEIGKGAGENHKHLKITDLKVGDTFIKGKVLAWDDMFLARDTRDPNRVCLKLGTMTRIALVEEQFTFEDSVAITKEYAERTTTPYIKVNSFVAAFNQVLNFHVKVGDTVEYYQPLADLQEVGSAAFNDNDAMAGLERLGIKQIRAKQPGRITKIDVIYNGDIEDAEESIKKFVKQHDGARAKKAKYRELEATTGDVGGNTSIGKSKVYPGTVVIEVYIENSLTTTVADKFVAGNQMKGTVGFIYPTPIYTEDGRKVDWKFSLKSLLNRMVLSLRDKLVANEINNVYVLRMKSKYGRYE